MSYDIRKFDNSSAFTVADNVIDTAQTSINLVGQFVENYAPPIGESLVWIMESFANNTAPPNPMRGQIWFDTSVNQVKVYNGTSWDTLSGATQVASDLQDHINDPSAHTKAQVGLGNVANALQLIASNNFSDVPSKPTARTNLDVYGKSETYSQTEVDALLGGIGSGDMLSTNNLSDVANVATARTNLGVYSTTEVDNLFSTTTVNNSDLLDNLDSTQFLRSDASDESTGLITFSAGLAVAEGQKITFSSTNTDASEIYKHNVAADDTDLRIMISDNAGDTGDRVVFGTDNGAWTDHAWINANGDIYATNDIIAFASDKRLKTNIEKVENALDTVCKWTGIYYNFNDEAAKHGFDKDERQVGFFAQDINETTPEATALAPFDNERGHSRSGEDYLTIKHDRLLPFLVESIKELSEQIQEIKAQLKDIKK